MLFLVYSTKTVPNNIQVMSSRFFTVPSSLLRCKAIFVVNFIIAFLKINSIENDAQILNIAKKRNNFKFDDAKENGVYLYIIDKYNYGHKILIPRGQTNI